jgi:ATP-binding cassette subfamily B protein
MIAKFYGRSFSLQQLRDRCQINRDGVSLLGISEAATQIGFRTVSIKTSLNVLQKERVLPCIAHWQQNHFIVIHKISKKSVWIADPARGKIRYNKTDFINGWAVGEQEQLPVGIILLTEPTFRFFNSEEEEEKSSKLNMRNIGIHFLRYKRLFLQLMLSLLTANLLQLFFPFFAQAVVDIGIGTKDTQLIYLLLIGQLMLYTGSTVVDFIRGWIMLHISSRINISLVSDFLVKLMKLPLSYFDVKIIGDIMQRMGDHSRIESFLTGNAIGMVFSLFNFIVFTLMIILYDAKLFFIFAGGSVAYFGWIYSFLHIRRKLDFRRFDVGAKNQSAIIQLITGMQEIKMNDCEQQKRWEWERIQARLFHLNIRSLSLSQIQQGGAFFINQIKNIFITFFSAKAVIDGHLTLGGMMALQYIIGQLNGPVQQFIQFVQSYQDAHISLERINEIHSTPDEEITEKHTVVQLPADKSIVIKNLSYKYPGYDNNFVLEDINIRIPHGKTTAIVGLSGSGKTTLIKLLLKFYSPSKGEILINQTRFENIGHRFWRSQCGTVLQDGFIFSDSICNNISVKDEFPDISKLEHAINVANLQEFISSLPLGYYTKIGAEGNGISQGQRQRILLARAVYKDPEYIFLDEATNALDAINEKIIIQNLATYFKGKTVLVIAHRLSTVRHADQIIVLEKGKVIESGTHESLINAGGSYYLLVQNQLEIGHS